MTQRQSPSAAVDAVLILSGSKSGLDVYFWRIALMYCGGMLSWERHKTQNTAMVEFGRNLPAVGIDQGCFAHLVVSLKRLKELHVSQHAFGRTPEILDLLSCVRQGNGRSGLVSHEREKVHFV